MPSGGDEHPAAGQGRQRFRQGLARRAPDAVADRKPVHLEEQDGKIEHSRDQRRDDDVFVGNFQELGDNEGRGAHDRRRDLTAVRGHGLDRAGVLRPEAGLLHHRDGDDAGRHDVAHGRAGDRAEGAGRNDRDLCRAAAPMAHPAHGHIVEERRRAADLQQLAEDDKGKHQFGNDPQHDAGHAVVVGIEVKDGLGRREDFRLEHARQKIAEIGIGDEQPDQSGDDLAGGLAQAFQRENEGDDARPPHIGRPVRHTDDPEFEIDRHPRPGGDGGERQEQVEGRRLFTVGKFQQRRRRGDAQHDRDDLLGNQRQAEIIRDRQDPGDAQSRQESETAMQEPPADEGHADRSCAGARGRAYFRLASCLSLAAVQMPASL